MTIIDTHAHIYPDKIARKAAASIGDFYSIPMDLDGTVGELLRAGEEAGITRHLVHSVAVTWERVAAINDFIARSVEEHPDRFIGFGTMHPDHPDMEKELDRILFLGLKGVKTGGLTCTTIGNDPACIHQQGSGPVHSHDVCR